MAWELRATVEGAIWCCTVRDRRRVPPMSYVTIGHTRYLRFFVCGAAVF